MCVCVCVCACVCVCMYVYVCVCACMCVCMHAHVLCMNNIKLHPHFVGGLRVSSFDGGLIPLRVTGCLS